MGKFDRGYDEAYFKTAKRPEPLDGLQVGDKVIWTKYFLKSIGCGPTHANWRVVGVVTTITAAGAFAGWPAVSWDGADPTIVNPSNLAHHGKPSRRAVE